MNNLDSLISSVTVFSDRAQITRRGKTTLDSGEQHILFDKLPESIEQKSIRVIGSGNAILRDISFKTVNFSESQSDEVRKLRDEQKKLYDDLNSQETQKELVNKEKEFLDKITEKITSPEKTRNSGELNPESWIKMITFYRSKLEELERQERTSENRILIINEKLEKLTNDLNLLNRGNDKIRKQVEVTLEMKEAGEITLELTYIVYGPGWYPAYDLRVSTERKQMNITYNAIVTQATSEDWDNVQLKISTARPQIDGNIPVLNPWFINIYNRAPEPMRMMSKSLSSEMSKKSASFDEEAYDEPDFNQEVMSMAVPESHAETQATSVVFIPSGLNTVISDNTPSKVSLLISDFPAEFIYGSVPKLSPYTYLKAKVVNKSEYPLLSGECSVFLDNNFISNTYINTVAPEEEFWTSLGIDESLKSERKFIRRFEKKEGRISKKTLYIYEYKLIIENKKKSDEILKLLDQIPVSGHQDISIELINPKIEKGSDNPKMNEEKILEWHLKLSAGEKIEIPFSFSVEHPRDVLVEGLE